MISFTTKIDEASVKQAMEESTVYYGSLMVGMLTMYGFNSVAFLRSLTNEQRPPAKKGEGPRWAHPGHWADISSHLALSYGFTVQDGSGRVIREPVLSVTGARAPFTLDLFNSSEYAIYLEKRHGFWVLSGYTDPGAAGEKVLREAINAVSGMEAA